MVSGTDAARSVRKMHRRRVPLPPDAILAADAVLEAEAQIQMLLMQDKDNEGLRDVLRTLRKERAWG
jgi:hypothetical protein